MEIAREMAQYEWGRLPQLHTGKLHPTFRHQMPWRRLTVQSHISGLYYASATRPRSSSRHLCEGWRRSNMVKSGRSQYTPSDYRARWMVAAIGD